MEFLLSSAKILLYIVYHRPPVKRTKGKSTFVRQFKKAADNLFSTAVSKIRQSIEVFFIDLLKKPIFKELVKCAQRKDLLFISLVKLPLL